jgi:hypothetical protein
MLNMKSWMLGLQNLMPNMDCYSITGKPVFL